MKNIIQALIFAALILAGGLARAQFSDEKPKCTPLAEIKAMPFYKWHFHQCKLGSIVYPSLISLYSDPKKACAVVPDGDGACSRYSTVWDYQSTPTLYCSIPVRGEKVDGAGRWRIVTLRHEIKVFHMENCPGGPGQERTKEAFVEQMPELERQAYLEQLDSIDYTKIMW